MNLLAIDTSSTACSVALLHNQKVTSATEIAPMQQTQKILPMIQSILNEANISLNQIDAIAFGCGPGSFTGVRLATSISQGMGYALNLPLIPISSLAALAQAAYEDLGWRKLLVAVDARIQEVYCGAFEVNSQNLVELVGVERVCPPQDILFPTGNEWSGVGDAWTVYHDNMVFIPQQIDSSRLPLAKGVLALAKFHFEQKQWVAPEDALPTYLRDQVAHKPK